MISTMLLISGVILLVIGLLKFSLLLWHAHDAHRCRKKHFSSSLELLRDRIGAAKAQSPKRSGGPAWRGYRQFRVARKTLENRVSVCSLALVPRDGMPLAAYAPGQYLTLRIAVPGQSKPVIRCYSLSDYQSKSTTHYRVTIKKLSAPLNEQNVPPGVASTYIYDQVEEGDTLEVKAPAGTFVLGQDNDAPVVLVAGGIGVTPLLSMLNAIVASGSKRETWFYYGVRNGIEHIMREHLDRIRRECSNVHIRIFYSTPRENDRECIDYDCAGRISVDRIQQEAPWKDSVFYVCGPFSMMTSLTKGLLASGIPNTRIRSEAFGAASVPTNRPARGRAPATEAAIHVTFSKADKRIPWNQQASNLLEFARENGVEIESGCRAGKCGTCSVKVKAGDVVYLQDPEVECEPDTCLACITAPSTDLTIEA